MKIYNTEFNMYIGKRRRVKLNLRIFYDMRGETYCCRISGEKMKKKRTNTYD